MSDLIAPPEVVEKMDMRERPHRLQTSDGGGVIFPDGFFGPGYYLPEWEYLRYCTRADHFELNPEALTWWQRHILRPSAIGTGAILIASWALSHYIDGQLIESQGMNVGGLLFLAVFCKRFHGAFLSQPRRMAAAFPTAKRLSAYRYWLVRARRVSEKVGLRSIFGDLFWSSMFALLSVFFFKLAEDGEMHVIVAAAIVPFLLAFALHRPTILISMAIARMRFGRVPAAGDLPPVEPPVSAP